VKTHGSPSGNGDAGSDVGSARNHVRTVRKGVREVFGLKLGIVWRDGLVSNHRSLLKIVCNPVLRVFGYQIATQILLPSDGPAAWKIVLRRIQKPQKNLLANLWNSWVYTARYDFIQKQRRLW